MTFIKHLKLNKICKDFAYREIAVLAQFVKEDKYSRGEIVFKEGEEGEKLFLVVNGEVGIKSSFLGQLNDYVSSFSPGDFFGELALFGAGPRRVTAIAIADNTILFSMSREDFEIMSGTEPFVSYKLIMELLEIFSNKLKEGKDELSELFSSKKLTTAP